MAKTVTPATQLPVRLPGGGTRVETTAAVPQIPPIQLIAPQPNKVVTGAPTAGISYPGGGTRPIETVGLTPPSPLPPMLPDVQAMTGGVVGSGLLPAPAVAPTPQPTPMPLPSPNQPPATNEVDLAARVRNLAMMMPSPTLPDGGPSFNFQPLKAPGVGGGGTIGVPPVGNPPVGAGGQPVANHPTIPGVTGGPISVTPPQPIISGPGPGTTPSPGGVLPGNSIGVPGTVSPGAGEPPLTQITAPPITTAPGETPGVSDVLTGAQAGSLLGGLLLGPGGALPGLLAGGVGTAAGGGGSTEPAPTLTVASDALNQPGSLAFAGSLLAPGTNPANLNIVNTDAAMTAINSTLASLPPAAQAAVGAYLQQGMPIDQAMAQANFDAMNSIYDSSLNPNSGRFAALGKWAEGGIGRFTRGPNAQ